MLISTNACNSHEDIRYLFKIRMAMHKILLMHNSKKKERIQELWVLRNAVYTTTAKGKDRDCLFQN